MPKDAPCIPERIGMCLVVAASIFPRVKSAAFLSLGCRVLPFVDIASRVPSLVPCVLDGSPVMSLEVAGPRYRAMPGAASVKSYFYGVRGVQKGTGKVIAERSSTDTTPVLCLSHTKSVYLGNRGQGIGISSSHDFSLL